VIIRHSRFLLAINDSPTKSHDWTVITKRKEASRRNGK